MAKTESKLNMELPKDPAVLGGCLKNLFTALNKANKAGVYDLTESSQIANDLGMLSAVINQIVQLAYTQQQQQPAQQPVQQQPAQ